jgi:adenylate cyclase
MPAASSAPRRQLSAILFADVHGYSRLMAKNEQRTYERLTQSLRLIRSLMADYGGQFIRTAGDGVLALFETAPQALGFAIAIQRELRNDAVWNADDEPIVFRIGINLGEVLIGEADIQGHSVNVAARIQALAHPGGICITDTVQRAVRDTLGIAMHALGRRGLKNIDEPGEVFAIEVNGAELMRPTPAAMPQFPSCRPSFRPARRGSRFCRLTTFRAIRGTSICATASRATSSPICRAFATWQ